MNAYKSMGDLISRRAIIKDFIKCCGPQTGDGWDNFGVRALIDRQKTVKAIPIEWLRNVQNQYERYAAMWLAIESLIEMWEKEQDGEE